MGLRIGIIHSEYRSTIPSGENLTVKTIAGILKGLGHEVNYKSLNSDIYMSSPLAAASQSLNILATSKVQEEHFREWVLSNDLVQIHNNFPILTFKNLSFLKQAEKPIVRVVHNYRKSCLKGNHFRAGQPCHKCNFERGLPGVIKGCYNDSILKSAFVNNFRRKINQIESDLSTSYIAISTTVKNYLLDLGVDDNKITVINNSVSSQNRITQNASEVFFAGRLEEEKGVLTALDTWEKFPNLPMLNILGSGSLSNIVESRAEKIENVTFFGPKFGVDFDRISQRCKVALILNRWEEPFGRTFAEALSRGQAIVSTNNGNAMSFLQIGVNGFCVSPDPADIAHKVELAMKLSIDRHATYGHNLWKNEYSNEAVTLQWSRYLRRFHQK